MRERGMLMKGPLVLQTIAGVKTMTRRVSGLEAINSAPDRYRLVNTVPVPGEPLCAFFRDEQTGAQTVVRCPQGSPGDRLWIRETWHALSFHATESYQAAYKADNKLGGEVIDWSEPRAAQASRFSDGDLRWFPAIHMPRWACRLVLEILSIRVERLQDISEADILAEGITVDRVAEWCNTPWSTMPTLHHAWRVLWESINGAGSWDADPWVWVVSYRRVV